MNKCLLAMGLSMILVVVVSIILSLFILLSDKKSAIHRSLFVLINLINCYILFDFLSNFTSGFTTTFFMRLDYGFGMLALGVFYYFSCNFPFSKDKKNIIKLADVILATLVVGFYVVAILTDLVVSSTQFAVWGVMINSGALMLPYFVFIVFLLIIGFWNIFSKYKYSTSAERMKIKFLLVGMMFFAITQLVFTIILPTFGIEQYYYLGDYSLIVFSALAAYAIMKYHLFDIRLAIVRSITYASVLVSLALIYLILAFVLSIVFSRNLNSPEQIISGVAISLILAFVFQPIRRFFDKITNRIFYKDYYNAEDFFARLNLDLSVTTDLRNLLEKVSKEIGQTLKSEQVFFYINTTDDRYISAGTTRHEQLPKDDISQLETLKKIVIASSLKTDSSIRRMMLSHRIEIAMPLYKGNNTIGCLCLGDNLSSGYTNRDIKVLSTISNELVIAIQNALAVQEIKELNSSLQQRIANATRELRTKNTSLRQLDKAKDEFVSMASHQLRTPLTSVKGYLSMVLEGDTGRITDPQRDLLNQAFASSERMVRLINDFLNVSRIQTGKFVIDKTPVMLPKLVSEEIDSLKPNAEARNLKFVYKPPKDFPAIKLDEGKIRQVVMNFADNAVYYSHENTAINIDLHIKDKKVFFAVKDSGIGVPKDEQEHLFTKFFRASNAKKQRPDGTGVGIYLAKRVIEAHGGEIIFESTEGQGSTFGFSLPIE